MAAVTAAMVKELRESTGAGMMEWVRRMRNLENRAAEIVKAELIYTFERR